MGEKNQDPATERNKKIFPAVTTAFINYIKKRKIFVSLIGTAFILNFCMLFLAFSGFSLSSTTNPNIVMHAYQTHWDYTHPQDYVGVVWIAVTPDVTNLGKTHAYEIKWGSRKYQGILNFPEHDAVFLKHTKGQPDAIPIDFSITPACKVNFGQGEFELSAKNVIDISDGWFPETNE